jgi:lycopene beta-cyclase
LDTHYDYIIAGAGAAGLSLVMHLIEIPELQVKKILLIEKEEKNRNDRTWCFWQKEPGLFEEILYHTWSKLNVAGPGFNKQESITPYTYKMIRGVDFYRYCFAKIKQNSNIEVISGTVHSIINGNSSATVFVNQKAFTATYVFSSILLQEPVLKKNQHYLLQHFKGQVIETTENIFDPESATYMDFRIAQTHGTSFGYVLPFAGNKALVEYTLLSRNTITETEYQNGLENYIRHFLKIETYTVMEEEYGVIPMTDYRFKKTDGRIHYIGTAGGNTRGSSGYTFAFIQKHCMALAAALANNRDPGTVKSPISAAAKYFDSILLSVLDHKGVSGQQVFCSILKKRKLSSLLSFLDDEGRLPNELAIIFAAPKGPFLKAAFRKMF